VGGPISRRKLIKRGLGLGVLAMAGDAFGFEPSALSVERVEVPIEGLGKSLDGYRIALFSDIHWPRRINRQHVQRVIGLANSFDPDLIAIPGDFFDGRGIDHRHVPDIAGLYDGLRSRDGIVYTLGNDDYIFRVANVHRELKAKSRLENIENRHRLIQRGADILAVGGVEDLYYGKPDPVRAFEGVSPDVPRILLSHNPDVAEDHVWPTRIDLQLSGHTHGGEVRIPFGPAPKIPSKYGQKFREGLVQGRSHRVYVTRGICSPRGMRFCCPPEVTHLTLRSA
jgi:hypothetical protein